MSHDDVLFGFRLRLFSLAGEIGVRPACRAMGVHHSTYYRWKRRVDRWGLEALRVRERRRPRMPNELGPHLEQRVLAFSLAHPGFGPKRISAELAREKGGGLRISSNGVWRVLCRHGLNTRSRRLSLVAGYAARYERRPPLPEPERHIEASRPGELLGLDCFYVGRLSGTKGAVWQYTAIDVASGFAWAELHTSPRNPRAEHPFRPFGSGGREAEPSSHLPVLAGRAQAGFFGTGPGRRHGERNGARRRRTAPPRRRRCRTCEGTPPETRRPARTANGRCRCFRRRRVRRRN